MDGSARFNSDSARGHHGERLHEDRQKQAQDHISSEPEGEPQNLATAKEPWALVAKQAKITALRNQ